MKEIVCLVFLLTSFGADAQFDWNTKNWDKESLGFGCSYSGQMTKPVLKMTHLLSNRSFSKMRKMLYSEVASEQFLAVFTLEALQDKKEIEISEIESKRIEEIKSSEQLVPFCSGCVIFIEIPLKVLFENETKGMVYEGAKYWFDSCLKKDGG